MSCLPNKVYAQTDKAKLKINKLSYFAKKPTTISVVVNKLNWA